MEVTFIALRTINQPANLPHEISRDENKLPQIVVIVVPFSASSSPSSSASASSATAAAIIIIFIVGYFAFCHARAAARSVYSSVSPPIGATVALSAIAVSTSLLMQLSLSIFHQATGCRQRAP
jgi:hypothetical protein